MRGLMFILMASAVTACTTAPQQAPIRSVEAEQHLNKLLAGKAAGEPVNCLPSWQSDDMVVVDDNTVVFRDSSRRVYVNTFSSGCSNLGSGWYTLVTRRTGGSLCSGEIAQVVDLNSGMTVGSCSFGEFVPYTRAG